MKRAIIFLFTTLILLSCSDSGESVTEKDESTVQTLNISTDKAVESTDTSEEIESQALPSSARSITDNLNIRALPSVYSERVGQIHQSEEAVIYAQTNWEERIQGQTSSWYKIDTGNIEGWVFGSYLEIINLNSESIETIESKPIFGIWEVVIPEDEEFYLRYDAEPNFEFIEKESIHITPSQEETFIYKIEIFREDGEPKFKTYHANESWTNNIEIRDDDLYIRFDMEPSLDRMNYSAGSNLGGAEWGIGYLIRK